MNENRTICALATPPGIAGLAVIRLSGEKAIEIAASIFKSKMNLNDAKSHSIHYGLIKDNDLLIDTVTASIFKSPNSYTGEDVVEISCHGGMIVSDQIISLMLKSGAFMAEAGEFTKRAFLNGKLDLTQVEAVADIIHAQSVPGTQTAARQLQGGFTGRLDNLRQELIDAAGLLELELDFSEEDFSFIDRNDVKNRLQKTSEFCNELASSFKSAEILRSGYIIALAGYPNSGKSTLFNALVQKDRAIVSDTPGTTRDYIEESIMISGLKINIIDTAGIRESEDFIEVEGIKLAEKVLEQANLIIVLNDFSEGKDNSYALYESLKSRFTEAESITVHNKIDKDSDLKVTNTQSELYISAKYKDGFESLKSFIESKAKVDNTRINDVLINQRQAQLLNRADQHIKSAINAIDLELENELISLDIRDAISCIGELTGKNWNEEILNAVFSRFCIGK